jgi:hypothetical protein
MYRHDLSRVVLNLYQWKNESLISAEIKPSISRVLYSVDQFEFQDL